MRSILLCTLIILAAGAAVLRAQDTESVSAADGFQCPVGSNGSGEGYYIARGYRPNGHLGDDWNGIKGGDTDMGDPVCATAHGIVVFAKNYHVGWGNVVIIRHGYYEGLSLKYVDSLYGHLADFNVREGQTVKRGQLIGHIGNNNGMYDAHLHFEIRKNINIGMFRSSFPRDDTNYYEPNRFVASHLTCPQGGKTVSVPINTFPATAPPSYIANKVYTPVYSPGSAPASHLPPAGAGSLATSLRLSHDLERKPTPIAIPAPKIVTAPPPTPKPAAPPAPVVETPTTASLTKSTPKPSSLPIASKTSTASAVSIPEKKESTTPSPKSAKTASSKPPAATPSPTKESATASTKQGTTSSTKESATASTKKAATPTPSSKSGTTASTKTANTPAPSTKATATTAKPPTTASTKTPVAPPAPSKEAASAKTTTPEPAPAKTAKAEPKPSILDLDTHEAPTPPSSTGSPIRRSQPAFRVDRFQDLRGMGY